MTILWSALFAIVGALVYAFVPGKATELGKIAFGAGLLVFLLQLGPRVFGIN